MRTKLAHVCIETDDLERTEAFYAALGLQRRYEFRNLANTLVGFYLAFGNQTFIEVIKTGKPRQTGVVRHFAIECDDLEAAREALAKLGVESSEVVLEKDLTRMVTCHDPNGIFIEIQQYTDDSMQIKGGICTVDYVP